MKHSKLLLFLFVSLIFSSCATIINKPNQNLQLKSNEDARLIVQGDTLNAPKGETISFNVQTKGQPLVIGVVKENNIQQLPIRKKLPPYYWGNLWTWGIGFIVDELSQDKLTYPSKLYLDLSEDPVSYLPYYPMEEARLKFKNKFSITPTALIGFYHPGIEVGYQRLLGERFAIETNFRHMIALDNDYARNASGFRVELNPKYYLRNQDKSRIYTSLSIEHLRKDHEAEFTFLIPANLDDDDFENDLTEQILPVEKRFISFTPRIGVEHYFSDRLVLDAFFGLGLRYRETRVLGVDPNFEFNGGEDDWFDHRYESNRPSNRLSANFDLNFSIGWVF